MNCGAVIEPLFSQYSKPTLVEISKSRSPVMESCRKRNCRHNMQHRRGQGRRAVALGFPYSQHYGASLVWFVLQTWLLYSCRCCSGRAICPMIGLFAGSRPANPNPLHKHLSELSVLVSNISPKLVTISVQIACNHPVMGTCIEIKYRGKYQVQVQRLY